jgi:hypothetical protein
VNIYPSPDDHGLGLGVVTTEDFVASGTRFMRCQWDGAILHAGLVAVHGPWDSPEPEYGSYCPVCHWEMTL